MAPDLPPVDEALEHVRRLLRDAGEPFKIVGGVAVVHHGYARTTEDIDVLLTAGAPRRLASSLGARGFAARGDLGLTHVPTGVRVDLLSGGQPLPRSGAGTFPSPEEVAGSERDPEVISLAGLIDLKLRAHRHRDLADVVELLKRLDEGHYTQIEASTAIGLRRELAALRRDALEELAGE